MKRNNAGLVGVGRAVELGRKSQPAPQIGNDMILIDMNQVCISNLMMQIGSKRQNDVDENLVRHMVLNSLRMYRSRFSEEFGELVLCYDSKKYWRRDFFPNYKSNRKKDREASGLDWNLIFETLNNIRDEIRDNFPYKVLDVEGAEADDCIATVVDYISKTPTALNRFLYYLVTRTLSSCRNTTL